MRLSYEKYVYSISISNTARAAFIVTLVLVIVTFAGITGTLHAFLFFDMPKHTCYHVGIVVIIQ